MFRNDCRNEKNVQNKLRNFGEIKKSERNEGIYQENWNFKVIKESSNTTGINL